jgi:hypothetical protein
MRRLLALSGAVLALSMVAAPVSADSVYHSERLTLEPVGGAAGWGSVVNIHPNGPQVFAHERYALVDASPEITYQVWLLIYASNLSCSGAPTVAIPTAGITTNAAGNGTAQFFLAPEDVPAFLRNQTFSINWEVTSGATLTHETRCTVVTLD